MAQPVRHPGPRRRARRGHPGRGRREPAADHRLAAAGAAAADGQDRLRAAGGARGAADGRRRRRTSARALPALRVQELAQGPLGWGHRGCGRRRRDRRPRGPRRTARVRDGRAVAGRAPSPGSAALRDGARRGRAGALAGAYPGLRPRRVRHRDDEPRSACGADRRAVVRRRARPRVLHPACAPLSGGAGPVGERPRARAARPLVRRPSPCQAGAEREVRPARARQPRPGAGGYRPRHDARVLRAGIAQAARHGQPRVATPRREDDHLRGDRRQGSEGDRLRPGRRRDGGGVRGRGRRRHVAAARRAAPAARTGGAAGSAVPDDRAAGARGAVPHGARRRAGRHGVAQRS